MLGEADFVQSPPRQPRSARRPRLCGRAARPALEDACGSRRSRVTRSWVAEEALDGLEIDWLGDLDQARIARHRLDPAASGLRRVPRSRSRRRPTAHRAAPARRTPAASGPRRALRAPPSPATRSNSTRLTVSVRGRTGIAPSQPSFSAVRTRSITSSDKTGRAASADEHHGSVLGHDTDGGGDGGRSRRSAGHGLDDLPTAELLGQQDHRLLPVGRRRDHDRVDPVRLLEPFQALQPAAGGRAGSRTPSAGRTESRRSPPRR